MRVRTQGRNVYSQLNVYLGLEETLKLSTKRLQRPWASKDYRATINYDTRDVSAMRGSGVQCCSKRGAMFALPYRNDMYGYSEFILS